MTLDQMEYYELFKSAISKSETSHLLDLLSVFENSKGIEWELVSKELRRREIDI